MPTEAVNSPQPLTEEELQSFTELKGRIDEGDHFSVLGLDSDSGADAVRDAYYGLSRRYHPDRFYRRELGEHMDQVMAKFDRTNAWNLPVLENGRYVGFVSRSKLFGAYRAWLQAVSEE